MSAANIKAGIEVTAQTDGADGIARLEAAVGRLDAAAHKAGIGTDALARAGGGLGAQADALPSKLTTLSSSISGMGRTMLAAAGVGGGIYAVKEGLQRILETTTEFAAIRSRMEYAFGGADGAVEQLEWVKGVAAGLGLELKSAANGYAQLAAATKNINMSTARTQQVFKGVASAAASMNLSTEETNGVLLALSHIAEKIPWRGADIITVRQEYRPGKCRISARITQISDGVMVRILIRIVHIGVAERTAGIKVVIHIKEDIFT